MHAREGGWWEARVHGAGADTDYWFRVDNGDPTPDPRSRWQPHGVHGPSRIPDEEFPWTDNRWTAPPLGSAIIYELHVGTFTAEGTFEGAISKLDYLAELGITHIELMPVAEFAGAWGWGYDGVDLFAPYSCYGGPRGLKKLIDACHARGLAVLLDVVYNHFGPSGNYLARFGPYTEDKYHTPWGSAINLDGRLCHEVRSFLLDNATMWLRDYHFDGLRLDAVHALIDNGARHFLEELAERVEALETELGRHLALIAETDLNDPRIMKTREIGGYGLDAQWSDDFHHALHTILTGENTGYYADFGGLERLAKALNHAFVYDGVYSRFRQRPHGRSPAGLAGDHFVVCIQNHDQIGNRARGERISHLVSPARARIAAALVLTSPFVPLIFQGEEWAASTPFLYFSQHQEPELARAVSEGRRNEFSAFGWDPADVPDPQDPATLHASRLKWDERRNPGHREMLDWYRKLIHLRRTIPELRCGDPARVEVQFDEAAGWLLVKRGRITIACNFGKAGWDAPISGRNQLLLASQERVRHDNGRLALPPDSVAVLESAADADLRESDRAATV